MKFNGCLLDYRANVFTSIGNDGIIEKIFEVIGLKHGYFVEFGAWDGVRGSNCRNLFMNKWQGTMIEANLGRYLKLAWNYRKHPEVTKIWGRVGTIGKG